jgi:hypothetical protein
LNEYYIVVIIEWPWRVDDSISLSITYLQLTKRRNIPEHYQHHTKLNKACFEEQIFFYSMAYIIVAVTNVPSGYQHRPGWINRDVSSTCCFKIYPFIWPSCFTMFKYVIKCPAHQWITTTHLCILGYVLLFHSRHIAPSLY